MRSYKYLLLFLMAWVGEINLPAATNVLTLMERGQAGAAIVIGAQGGPVAQFAAEELQSYVKQITGAPEIIPLRKPGVAGPGNEIVIGCPQTNPRLAQLCQQFGVSLDASLVGEDGYILKTINTGTNLVLLLASRSDRGALFAVYHLLENCGVRFFGYRSRDGEIVPHQNSLTVPVLDIVEKPHMKYRFISNNGFSPSNKTKLTDVADWGAKNRCNTFMLTPSHAGDSWRDIDLAEVQKRGMLIAGPGHFLAQLTPSEELFQSHPEYFPLLKGKRSPVYSAEWGGATGFCWSNPEAMQIVVNNAVKYFKQNPFINLYAIYPPDGSQHGVQCQCPECARQTMSDWYLTLLNRVDLALRALPNHPKLMWISYNECSVPPPHVRPAAQGQDFILVWCNELRDFHEPMDSPANHHATQVLRWKTRLKSIKTDWKKNPTDQDFAAWSRWERWKTYLTQAGYQGSVSLLEYYNEHVSKSLSVPMLGYCQSGPWPNDLMQKDFEFYDQQGITGWQNCTDYYNDKPNPYWNQLSARLMWNPKANVAAIDQDFYQKIYGAEGALMQKFFTGLWQEIASPDLSAASRGRIQALTPYLDQAEAQAASAHNAELSKCLHEARSFQAHCLDLKQQFAKNYNSDDSPKGK